MHGKRVLLGVTGGIAAYKSPDLVRRLREQGAEVQVVLTAGAREFVTPMTFQAVSGREVRSDLWDPEAEKAMSHIELARWADFVIIAPATADFLARLATGQADDLLTTLCLATAAPIALAPAMNRLMWANAATQANVATLKSRGVHVWGPGEGDQACGEVGAGRMLEPTAARGLRRQYASRPPVRWPASACCSPPGRRANASTRCASSAIAAPERWASRWPPPRARRAPTSPSSAARLRIATPPGVKRIDVESAADMLNAVMKNIDGVDIFVATAAVADYRPAIAGRMQDQENFRVDGSQDGAHRRHPRDGRGASGSARPFVVGFAAETDSVEQYARQKLLKKNLDMIAANEVGHDKVFEKDDNALAGAVARRPPRVAARAEGGAGARPGRADRRAVTPNARPARV